MYQEDLIYDVGMFNGDDTAYYLHRGYRVVSIEAHPTWAEDGHRRFAKEVDEGRLTILNVAIGAEEGMAQFVVNEQNRDWSTMNHDLPKIEAWAGMPLTLLDVRTVRFKDILEEHGVPYYLKVDIETFDHYCLEDLDPANLPKYASFEAQNFKDLVTMRDKGFTAFKVIRQQDHRQAHYDPHKWKQELKPHPTGWPGVLRALGMGVNNENGLPPAPVVKRGQHQPVPGWQFQGGNAGPFGDDADGPWRSFGEAAMTWLGYDMGLIGPEEPGEGKWHDIHCRS